MARIYLVRHGETDWNRAERFTGQQDVPLNEPGREQARRLGRRLQAPWTHCFSSDLGRCTETAQLLLAGYPSAPDAKALSDLREIDGGQFEGLTRDEQHRRFPDWHSAHSTADDPDRVPFPGGESFRQLKERSIAAITRLGKSEGPVLVVTHGGVIRAVLSHVLGVPSGRLARLAVDNCGVTVVEWESPLAARVLRANG